jgi:ABC-2 type transport system ATP-binding protein
MAATTTLAPPVSREVSDSPAIAVHGLTKRFGGVTAVDEVSFEVGIGRVVGFLGPNGAGKSTTLRMILGLVRPTKGHATIDGMPYGGLERPVRVVGAVLEAHSFHPSRSGRNHLRVMAAASGVSEARVEQVLAQVGLTAAAKRKAGAYSLGMRQRLGLAAALLGDPKVLILDEPANGLDPQGIRWLRNFLRGYVSEGNSVLLSSHILAEIAQMADDVIVLDHGRLIRQGTVEELTTGAPILRIRSPEAQRLATTLEAHGLPVHREGDDRLVVRGAGERVGAIALRQRIALSELTQAHSTLEDAFLELTEKEAR